MEKSTVFFVFSNLAIGVRRVFDAVPRFHGTMYRRQPVELHDTVRGNANVERDRPGEHPAALPATVHGGVLPWSVRKGNGRRWYSRTPLQSAAENEQFEIVQYLVKTCTNKVDLIGQTNSYGCNSLHYAAWYSKKNVQTLQFLIDNYNGKDIKTIINQKNKYEWRHTIRLCI